MSRPTRPRRSEATSRVRRRIEADPSFRSWSDLSRRSGIRQVDVKLDNATEQRRLARFDTLAAICQVTDLTLYDLVAAAAHDAGYGDLARPVDEEVWDLFALLVRAAPRTRALVKATAEAWEPVAAGSSTEA